MKVQGLSCVHLTRNPHPPIILELTQTSIFQYVPSSYIDGAELAEVGAGDGGTGTAARFIVGGVEASFWVGVIDFFALRPRLSLFFSGVATTRTGSGVDVFTTSPWWGNPGINAPEIVASCTPDPEADPAGP